MTATVQAIPRRSRRAYERMTTALAGKLFVPAEETTLECQIINLSAGGAGVQCAEPPPLQTFVVLYIEGFGRFEGVTNRFIQGELGVRFVCKDAKRQRLLRDLAVYISDGVTGVTRARRHLRHPSVATGYFLDAKGAYVRCDVLDMSLHGISLKTETRPPIGEVINLGQVSGRVIRHHADGIAIRFLGLAADREEPHGY